MTTLYPLCFHPSLLPSEERQRECGDGIYVSHACFNRFMNTDDEQLVIIEMTSGTRSVCAHICGVHESDDAVFAPIAVASREPSVTVPDPLGIMLIPILVSEPTAPNANALVVADATAPK